MSSVFLLVALTGSAKAQDIVKSPNDQREYRHVVLDNGLKVTLIHDAHTETAAAAMDVAVGSGSDPEDRPGLAHFLEHMLFLGTEKYPRPGDYAQFIKQHGGSKNAYTSFLNTNYYFNIESEMLEPALDRFSQFFIAPLFTEQLVQREKNAVHSEFSGGLKDDGRRFYSARRMAFNPSHPMSRFSVGNLDTLDDRTDGGIRDELIEFYNTHYSSNIMSLAIVGKQSLDQLEQWATEKFSDVPDRDAEVQRFDMDLFDKDSLPSRVNIVPLSEQRFMLLSFPVPWIEEHRFTRPRAYLGNILGHEGPGSLLSELKRKGWASGLSAGGGTDTRTRATIDIAISLTEQGVNHIDEIVQEVFHCVNRIRASGLPKWLHDERQLLDSLLFRFQEKSGVVGLVQSLSVRAQDWPAELLLVGPYRTTRFDVEGIRHWLEYMVPENLQLAVVAPGLDTKYTTPWYDVPYTIEAIADDVMEKWRNAGTNPRIVMPDANVFLPKDLELRPDGRGDPVKLIDEDKLIVWHRTDSSFRAPRANVRIDIQSPLRSKNPKSSVMSIIYARLVNEQLNEYSYAASLAGLQAGLTPSLRGIMINISGYADGQSRMLERIAQAMRNPDYTDTLFDRIRQQTIDEIENSALGAPYTRVISETQKLLYVPYFTDEQKVSALESLTVNELKTFAEDFLKKIRVVVLSHGNLTEVETLNNIKILQEAFIDEADTVDSVMNLRMVKLAEGKTRSRSLDLDHNDSAIAIYVQGTERHRASRARYALLRHLLSQPFKETLRTRQQLGYFVFVHSVDAIQVPSISLVIQSPTAGPGTLYSAVEKFLVDFEDELEQMSETTFRTNVESLAARIEERDTRLSERTQRYWRAISAQDFIFDSSERFARELRKVRKHDILALYRRLFIEKKAGRLVVYNKGRLAQEAADELLREMKPIVSESSFKADKPLLKPLSEIEGIE